ncbi:MAG TPA: Na(+)/H(+) antiporter subunit C, partial [Microbacterium sp.]|nr:Na(+)/H(+) antiporter subunit C [Microbacterium sp.]
QADTVQDDEADLAVRARDAEAEEVMDDETELEDDDATTDFIGTATSPIRVVHSRDFPGVRDDAPVDRPRRGPADPSRASESEDGA